MFYFAEAGTFIRHASAVVSFAIICDISLQAKAMAFILPICEGGSCGVIEIRGIHPNTRISGTRP